MLFVLRGWLLFVVLCVTHAVPRAPPASTLMHFGRLSSLHGVICFKGKPETELTSPCYLNISEDFRFVLSKLYYLSAGGHMYVNDRRPCMKSTSMLKWYDVFINIM